MHILGTATEVEARVRELLQSKLPPKTSLIFKEKESLDATHPFTDDEYSGFLTVSLKTQGVREPRILAMVGSQNAFTRFPDVDNNFERKYTYKIDESVVLGWLK